MVFQDFARSTIYDWGSALDAVEASLELEKAINEGLLKIHEVASTHGDAQLADFMEGGYLKEQMEAQEEIGNIITRMKRGDHLGIHITDKEL